MKLVVALVGALTAAVGQAAESSLPDDIRQTFENYVGTWKPDDGSDWDGKFTVEWLKPGQHCLVGRGTVWPKNQPDKSMNVYAIYGWDAKANEVLDAGFYSNGESRVFHWKVIAPGEWKHTARDSGPPDATFKLEKNKTTFTGADSEGNPISLVTIRAE